MHLLMQALMKMCMIKTKQCVKHCTSVVERGYAKNHLQNLRICTARSFQYSEETEMLERLNECWQAVLQITKLLNAYLCLAITWKLPNFSCVLCVRNCASQETRYTISSGLWGGVMLRVILLRTRFVIALLPDSTRHFHL